ncbi:tRNA modification GTPase GTPBP3 [Sistotremastrum suecicum HHB10207 ss-3]|uniref:tRNA modification GTPase GTPBP3 n=1 Tax=Sistotremastrum suecicum HHB10207 ss-3 TaxID=1314776 RepID=A0A166HSD1_9AGAM|nr:tRNA modification GTPase GTPBP3 [Sistotremastrum suecicum HHB10207 ss-3]
MLQPRISRTTRLPFSKRFLQTVVPSARTLLSSLKERKTIYALSTPPGKAGIGVIRISGPGSSDVYERMVKLSNGSNRKPTPWKMRRCHVLSLEGETLDDGLCVFFKGKSFTTEDMLELHVHSGSAVLKAVLNTLGRIDGCRPADPGEFTRRAFEAGRIDLTEVEGIRDVIDAETDEQRKLALSAAGGETKRRIESIRQQLIRCLANVEAVIDFGEGEDLEEGVFETAQGSARKLLAEIRGHLDDGRRGEIMRSGIRLAIFGPPNVGKSSLLNFLAQREAAIVTPIAGTTRDVLEVTLDIGGMPVVIADTAGIRKSEDVVESIGIAKAETTATTADVRICMLSMSAMDSAEAMAEHVAGVSSLIDQDTLIILNKADEQSDIDLCALEKLVGARSLWTMSLLQRTGVAEFVDGFGRELRRRFDVAPDRRPLITQARHRVHLERASEFISAFIGYSVDEVVEGAEELRYAADELGRIGGQIAVEDVLDALFRDFCIGK